MIFVNAKIETINDSVFAVHLQRDDYEQFI